MWRYIIAFVSNKQKTFLTGHDSSLGVPNSWNILSSWSRSDSPGNSGVCSSKKTHCGAHVNTILKVYNLCSTMFSRGIVILTASSPDNWRPLLHPRWRLFSRSGWNPRTSPSMKQSILLRIVHSAETDIYVWCYALLAVHSKKRRNTIKYFSLLVVLKCLDLNPSPSTESVKKYVDGIVGVSSVQFFVPFLGLWCAMQQSSLYCNILLKNFTRWLYRQCYTRQQQWHQPEEVVQQTRNQLTTHQCPLRSSWHQTAAREHGTTFNHNVNSW